MTKSNIEYPGNLLPEVDRHQWWLHRGTQTLRQGWKRLYQLCWTPPPPHDTGGETEWRGSRTAPGRSRGQQGEHQLRELCEVLSPTDKENNHHYSLYYSYRTVMNGWDGLSPVNWKIEEHHCQFSTFLSYVFLDKLTFWKTYCDFR